MYCFYSCTKLMVISRTRSVIRKGGMLRFDPSILFTWQTALLQCIHLRYVFSLRMNHITYVKRRKWKTLGTAHVV